VVTPPYQPRLSTWGHVWRYLLVVAISAVAWFELSQWQWQHARWWFWADLALGLAALAALPARRRHPVVVAAVTNAFTFGSASSTGQATLALVSLATRRRWMEILPVGVLSLVAGLVMEAVNPISSEPSVLTTPLVLVVVSATVGWGMYVGSRRELLHMLRDRAETAEREQAARVAQARTAERSRIAREMHDVLAHRISLVSMHAGALAYRDDLRPEEVRSTAGVVQDAAHQALTDLREVLGVLRDGPGDSLPELPQPSAADLPTLVDEACRAGMRVTLDRAVDLDAVPNLLGRTVYRIVQEGVTNARKHAAGTVVTARVGGSPGEGLCVEVVNPLRIGDRTTSTPPSGLGLIGMAERTALAGGRLSHRVTPDQRFVLKAWLPWPT
jgi:signal transduction histidine kinase